MYPTKRCILVTTFIININQILKPIEIFPFIVIVRIIESQQWIPLNDVSVMNLFKYIFNDSKRIVLLRKLDSIKGFYRRNLLPNSFAWKYLRIKSMKGLNSFHAILLVIEPTVLKSIHWLSKCKWVPCLQDTYYSASFAGFSPVSLGLY